MSPDKKAKKPTGRMERTVKVRASGDSCTSSMVVPGSTGITCGASGSRRRARSLAARTLSACLRTRSKSCTCCVASQRPASVRVSAGRWSACVRRRTVPRAASQR